MKNCKKFFSVFLALLLCFGTFSGIATSAYAASSMTLYMVEMPRGTDANRTGWDAPAVSLMGGWESAARKTYVLTSGSYNGPAVYCIEPGISAHSRTSYSERGEDYWDNYPSDLNPTIPPAIIKAYIGRIMQYGWQGNGNTSWNSANPNDANEIAAYFATQMLIWEVIVGERDSQFNHVYGSSVGKNNVIDQIAPNHPLRDLIFAIYGQIEASVQRHTMLPSFFSHSTGSAGTYELKWDGTQYIAQLTDTNGVLGNYTYSSSTPGLRFSVNGNVLTITSDTAVKGAVTVRAEKVNGQRRGVVVWSDGNIRGGNQNCASYGAMVSDPVTGFMNLEVKTGSVKIVKTSEDGKIAGISFTVEGEGVNQTVTTNNSGEIQIDDLNPGVYTVTENPIDRYVPQQVQRVTVVSGQVATVNFDNVLKRGDLTVTKTSEDGLNKGVKFHLFGTSLSGIPVDEYAVTDASGKATFKNILIGTGYVLEEVDTAIRYVVPESQTAAVEWNTVTGKNVQNILKKFRVTLTKSDAETGTSQGNTSLAGATYGLYKGGVLIDSYTTDANGQFTTGYYVCGDDWTILEISPSEGYLLDTATYPVGAQAELYTIELNTTANDVTEQIIKGNIALIKHTDDGETQLETPEAGAEFAVYLKSAGSYDAAKESERDTLICDENGYAETKMLPYGIYTVHQTKGWEGRELLADFDVYIAKDGQTYRYLANNAAFESYLKIVKVDAETGNIIPLASTGFQLYRPDGSLITQTFTYPTPTTIDTFYTNADGCLVTPEKLEYGTGYRLVEVSAPYGYVLNGEPVSFDVTADNATEENAVIVIEVMKKNTAQKGIVKISKSGEVFASVMEAEGLFQPVYEVQGLPGAVYEITAAEDIITPDGTLRAAAGEIVDTITTDDTGLAESKPLYLGSYEIREIEAPYGMTLNEEISTVSLVYAGQEIEITETAASFYNERQKAAVSLDKVLEKNTDYGIGMNGEITAVTFGLFAADDLTAADGTTIPADGLLEIISVNENGHAEVKSDLPLGSFYLKELSTDNHYLLGDTVYPINFEYAGQDTALVEIEANEGNAIKNDLIYGSVRGLKKDGDGNALAGAVFGLFRADAEQFTAETALATAMSAEDGSFAFENVPYGDWVCREIAAPTGYLMSDTAFPVTVDENDALIELEFTNEQIRGAVRLTKVDKDYPDNKLTCAEFEVYRDVNGDKALDDGDEKLGKLSEVSTGIYEMTDLVYGGYLVRETKAPEGFYLDENAYYFEIVEDGKIVIVENEAGKGFMNAAQVGSLKIVKTSSDGNVSGFTFRVTGPNGYAQDFTTGTDGVILIENLRIGEYTVSEVSDNASASYVLPADKTATVFEGVTATVEMHNILRDTPKTGDESSPALWIILTGLAAAGALACGGMLYVNAKKKK